MKPTGETYGALQKAYEHFNAQLFEGSLPDCLLTLQRKGRRVMGFFCGNRFEHNESRALTDEIALNPQHFAATAVESTLATLVHEMVHLWQEHFGAKKPKSRWHNKEWAGKMKAIGLHPSDTGAPGGREVGQSMTHYVIEGGSFAQACRALLTDGFRLSWAEAQGAVEGEGGGEGDGEQEVDRSNRARFDCPGCKAKAWGKPELKLVCGTCREPMARHEHAQST